MQLGTGPQYSVIQLLEIISRIVERINQSARQSHDVTNKRKEVSFTLRGRLMAEVDVQICTRGDPRIDFKTRDI